MPVPHAPHVSLAADEQHRLESIVRAHSTPQALSFRCQLILRAPSIDVRMEIRAGVMRADGLNNVRKIRHNLGVKPRVTRPASR
jgi:hypothetical protein